MAGRSAGFAIGIGVDDDAASKRLDAFNKRIAALTAPAERFNKSVAKFGEVTGINRAAEGMQTLGDRTLGLARAVERVAGPMASITSATSLAGMVELSRRWADAGNSISKTANLLDTPVSRLSALRGAARLAGSSAEAMDSSLKGLSETLHAAYYNRDASAQMHLKALGIDWRDAKGNITTVEAALDKLADKVATYKDHATAGRALSIVGVDKDLLPLLEKGQAGLDAFLAKAEETGGVMTAQMAANAKKMNSSWQELSLAIDGVGNHIVDSWSGTATKILDTTSHWIERNQDLAASYGKDASAVVAAVGVLSAIKPAVWILRALGLLGPAELVAVAGGVYAGFKGAVKTGTDVAAAGQVGLRPAMIDEYGNPIGYRDASGRYYTNDDAARIASHRSFHGEGDYMPTITGGAGNVSSDQRHNPLNLRFVSGQAGASPTSSGFGAYGSDEQGVAAAERQLLLYKKRGITKLSDIISTWAPRADHNDTDAYIARVAASAGWAATTDVDASDPAQAARLIAAMAPNETHALDPAVVGRGVAFGLGRTLDPATLGGAQAGAGHVQVDIHLHGAPPGTTARATASGVAHASPPRVETSMPMVSGGVPWT